MEISEFKKQMQEMTEEKVEWGSQLKALNHQKTEFQVWMKGKWFSLKISMFQLEKEKFESEKVIFEETRKWFTQEIANRDNQISTLRIEAVGLLF